MKDIGEASRREVVELHEFFEAWFTGRAPDSGAAFARAREALGPSFQLVSPRGVVDDRQSILDQIRAGHGKRPGFRLWIEELCVRHASDHLCLVTYEEHQAHDGHESTRISSALFGARPDAPNGVEWLHVHETFCAPREPRGSEGTP